MPIVAEEVVACGHTWKINQLGAIEGLRVFGLLSSALAEPMSEFAKAFGVAKLRNAALAAGKDGKVELPKKDVSPEAMAAMTRKILEALGDPRIQDAVQSMLKTVTKDGIRVDFDQEFAGSYGPLVQLIPFALKINFSSFLAGNPDVAAFVHRLEGMTRAKQTSTGGSGASS